VLVESVSGGVAEGRSAHQAPEVDGTTTIRDASGTAVGDLVRARVLSSDGVDLEAVPVESFDPVPPGTRP
jgi:hypothetical protein